MLKSVLVLLFVCCVQLILCQLNYRDNSDEDLKSSVWNSPNYRSFAGLWPDFMDNGNVPRKSPDVDIDDGREREPLSPDYKDPKGSPPYTPKSPKPSQTDFSVVDVPASGGGFPNLFPPSQFPSVFNQFPGGFFNLFSNVRSSKPWWKGSNVCTDKEEIMEDTDDSKEGKSDGDEESAFFSNIKFSTCQQTPSKYECTTKIGVNGVMKTFVVKYKCCHGYQRKPSEPGCTKIEMKNMLETIQDNAGQEFPSLIRYYDLDDKLSNENLSVFVPNDKSMTDFTERILELNNVDLKDPHVRRRRASSDLKNAVSAKELVLSHFVPGFVELADISNEKVLYSTNSNSTIRINVFPTPTDEKLITANCVPVIKKDILAINGIVNVMDGVLVPVKQTLMQTINENPKFSSLKKALEGIDFPELLDPKKHYTIFAPDNEAFEKLPADVRDKIFRGDACSKNILRHHILSHTVCTSAITMNATTHNVEGVPLSLRRDDENNLILDNTAKVTESDIVTTNGIIHVIDKVLVPDSGLNTDEIMNKQNLTVFKRLLVDAGMSDLMNSIKNVTLFIPTNEALKENAAEIEKIKNDPDKMKKFIMYHVVDGERKSCDLNDNEMLKTAVEGEKIRVNLYSTLPLFKNIFNRATINCARLVNFDEQACGTVVHQVNKVLVPAKESILDIINKNEDYEVLRSVLSGTDLEKTLKESDDDFTFLAPTNEAFYKLPERELTKLKENKEKANEVLKMHVLPDVLCCSGVGYQSFPFNERVDTLSNFSIQPSHDSKHRVRFEDSTVTKCDQVATNGVVHAVNKVLASPRRSHHPLADWGFMMLDL